MGIAAIKSKGHKIKLFSFATCASIAISVLLIYINKVELKTLLKSRSVPLYRLNFI
jgi:hypothetical protein